MRTQEALDEPHELLARPPLRGFAPMLILHEELGRLHRRPADVLRKARSGAEPRLRRILPHDVRAGEVAERREVVDNGRVVEGAYSEARVACAGKQASGCARCVGSRRGHGRAAWTLPPSAASAVSLLSSVAEYTVPLRAAALKTAGLFITARAALVAAT